MKSMSNPKIYLDYNATTPVDPQVYEKMEPYFREHFGNSASGQHSWGWTAESAITHARKQVADLIEAEPLEIIFTSGATESNNWALFGLIREWRRENPESPLHILTSAVEHSSIMNAGRALQELGVEVQFLPVNRYGQVDVADVRAALRPHTRLLSFIWANNEIGSLNPMRELAALAKEKRIYLHSDATQAVGKIPVSMKEIGVDLMSFSGHKIYGPKGVGALYLRQRDPKVSLQPLFYGGGHERGLRSGTVNVPGVVGLGEACERCRVELPSEQSRLSELRDFFIGRVLREISGSRLNGHPHERSPINTSLTFPGRPVELALPRLQGLGFSTGSACSAGRISISHVLAGIGVSEDDAQCTVRMSLGRWTTKEELDAAVEKLKVAFATAAAQ